MERKDLAEWINQPKTKSILLAFSVPKTPKQVEKELTLIKLKTHPFLTKGLLECLNPTARKGRLYIITPKTRSLLQLSWVRKKLQNDWQVFGKVIASPRQKLVIILTIDDQKRTSEEIRLNAVPKNDHLSRISTKEILNSLVRDKLIATKIVNRRRFYWITNRGKQVKNNLLYHSPDIQSYV